MKILCTGYKGFIGSYVKKLFPDAIGYDIKETPEDNVLNEQKLQYSGSINTETQQELGEMLGASHLLIIDYSRFYVSNVEALDIETHKLIEIKSGKVLASISLRSKVQYVQH